MGLIVIVGSFRAARRLVLLRPVRFSRHTLGRFMIRCLANNVSNTVLIDAQGARLAYSPYGTCFGRARLEPAFNGELKELPGGDYLLGSKRMYRPAAFRFAMPDHRSPFQEGGLNAYAYCLADPVNRADPGGEVSVFILARQIVWWGTRIKAMIAGVKGIQRVKEVAKWGKYVGSGLARLGVPGAATLAEMSAYTALAVKGAQTGRGLWKTLSDLRPRMAIGAVTPTVRRSSTSRVETGFAGSLGLMITDIDVDNSAFSPYVGDLLPMR